jgi:hypothetical protein
MAIVGATRREIGDTYVDIGNAKKGRDDLNAIVKEYNKLTKLGMEQGRQGNKDGMLSYFRTAATLSGKALEMFPGVDTQRKFTQVFGTTGTMVEDVRRQVEPAKQIKEAVRNSK